VGRSVPALEAVDGGCWVVCMPFLKPFMPQTHTVPGFRVNPSQGGFLFGSSLGAEQKREPEPFLFFDAPDVSIGKT